MRVSIDAGIGRFCGYPHYCTTCRSVECGINTETWTTPMNVTEEQQMCTIYGHAVLWETRVKDWQ